jgi:hypothetical protein
MNGPSGPRPLWILRFRFFLRVEKGPLDWLRLVSCDAWRDFANLERLRGLRSAMADDAYHVLYVCRNLAVFFAGVITTWTFTSIFPKSNVTRKYDTSALPRSCPIAKPCADCPRPSSSSGIQSLNCPPQSNALQAILPLPHLWCPHGSHGKPPEYPVWLHS